MNLVDQFGVAAFINKYRGALFLHNNDVLMVEGAMHDSTSIRCIKVDASNTSRVEVVVAAAHFSDIGVMGSFRPGWRVYASGTQAVYCSRNSVGYYKGFRVGDILTARLVPTTSRTSYTKYPTYSELSYAIVKPEIIPYNEGVQMLRNKERLMFTPDLQRCVVNTSDGIKDFYFGGAL